MNRRMNRDRLNLGAYILQDYARTEQHIKDVADSGLDFIVCMADDRKALDLFEKYNLGAVVTGVLPGWWGGDGDNAGKLEATHPMGEYETALSAFKDHPAIWGVDCGDEPSALDFPYYGKVLDKVNSTLPNQFGYLNLYPNYASVSQNSADETVNQLGTPTYAEHIEQYCKFVPTDYICYDFYLYSINVTKAYENLRIVSDACLRTGRDMWIVLQVNSDPRHKDQLMTPAMLRYQAYMAMAFGTRNIIWACYTGGWWENNVLDKQGNKTTQYDRMKLVNGELRRMGERYMQYRRTATHFIGFAGTPWMEEVEQDSVDVLDTGFFKGVRAEDGSALLAGEMSDGKGGRALMLLSADDPYDEHPVTRKVIFSVPASAEVTAFGGNGYVPVTHNADGSFSVEITSNEGILIETR